MLPIRSASTAAYLSIKATKLTHNKNKILLDNAPEDIRRLCRKHLVQMSVADVVIEEFLGNPNFSPRHETFLVHALAEMEGVKGRDQLVKQALMAESEEDAFVFQRLAELMLGYHNNVKPISEIIPIRRVVAGYTADQILVATLPIDYLQWTERTALGLEAVTRIKDSNRPVKGVEMWITGTLSPRTRQELKTSRITIKEKVGEILMPTT